MGELHELTMPSSAAIFLRNELKEMIKHCDLDNDEIISLINLAEGLDATNRIEITVI